MSTELAIPLPTGPSPPAQVCAAEGLLSAFLAGRSPRTVRAYSSDLDQFARWMMAPSASDAVTVLISLVPGNANGLALRYLASMRESGLSPATISRRLAALRSVVSMARTLGRVTWHLEVRGPRPEARRDSRGPDKADRKKLWKCLSLGDSPKARRDRAIVALLFDLGLRRSEALGLDLADVDLKSGSVAVVGKGHTEKERLTLPPATRNALASWILPRGDGPGPLFSRLDRGSASRDRLTGDGLARTLAAIGRRARLSRPLRPHGLRHAAITAALDSGADVRDVRRFSRHAKIETVMRYDDDRSDVAGAVAKKVSGERKS